MTEGEHGGAQGQERHGRTGKVAGGKKSWDGSGVLREEDLEPLPEKGSERQRPGCTWSSKPALKKCNFMFLVTGRGRQAVGFVDINATKQKTSACRLLEEARHCSVGSPLGSQLDSCRLTQLEADI